MFSEAPTSLKSGMAPAALQSIHILSRSRVALISFILSEKSLSFTRKPSESLSLYNDHL